MNRCRQEKAVSARFPRVFIGLMLAPMTFACAADESLWQTDIKGHLKYQADGRIYPDDSAYATQFGASSVDQNANTRINLQLHQPGVELHLDYQLMVMANDAGRRDASQPNALFSLKPSDERRFMNLTHTLSSQTDAELIHRIDRLYVGIARDQWVARAGRQAISWGNGLLFAPMDIFNPFDPTAVDKEYKSGDDLAYLQYLRNNGDDIQSVWVVRRDDHEAATQAVASQAIKYHGLAGAAEFDVLAARHYDENIIALGASHPLGELLWRGDLTGTEIEPGWRPSLVTSVSFSSIRYGKNLTGLVEYFYNGLGLKHNEYDQLAHHTALLERLARGELYSIGRHYLASSISVEMTPLLLFSPTLFINLGDRSVLGQAMLTYNFSQNTHLTASINLPIGADNTEFGGLQTASGQAPMRIEASLFVQAAWYF